MFFAGLLSAVAVKLASSIDDVLWLAPFLTANVSSKVRWQNAMIYLSVCMIQTVVAMLIAGSGSEAVTWLTSNEKHAWSTDKILTVFAGTLLALYTVKLTYEHFTGDEEGDDQDSREGAGHESKDESRADHESKDESRVSETTAEYASVSDESTVASDMELGQVAKDKILLGRTTPTHKEVRLEAIDESVSPAPLSPRQMQESKGLLEEIQVEDAECGLQADAECGLQGRLLRRASSAALMRPAEQGQEQLTRGASKQNADKKRQQALFMIAFIGSVDDLTLFVPMLVGKGFDWLQLTCGAAIAGSTIILLCLFIGLCKPVADLISKIPLFFIVAAFSVVLLSKAFFMQ